MKKAPPKKQAGQAKVPRTLNGEVMDVAAVAAFLGCNPKVVRGRIGRGLLPHRKWGGARGRPAIGAYSVYAEAGRHLCC